MMISPDVFREEHQGESYRELLAVRDELLAAIAAFEKDEAPDSAAFIAPSPDVAYQCNLMYLAEICQLMQVKFNEEFEQDGEDEGEEIEGGWGTDA